MASTENDGLESEGQAGDTDYSKAPRRLIKLSAISEQFYQETDNGSRNRILANMIDLGLPLHKAGLTNSKAIKAVIDTGVFNLFEIILNPNSSENTVSAMKWAAAKAILGDDIEMIKSGSVIVTKSPETPPAEANPTLQEPTPKSAREPRVLVKRKVPAFLQ
jgi:hypothetical protein